MEVQLNSAPKGNGPLAEIEYWKERHANLSALDEQLNRPKVQEIVKVTTQHNNIIPYCVLLYG